MSGPRFPHTLRGDPPASASYRDPDGPGLRPHHSGPASVLRPGRLRREDLQSGPACGLLATQREPCVQSQGPGLDLRAKEAVVSLHGKRRSRGICPGHPEEPAASGCARSPAGASRCKHGPASRSPRPAHRRPQSPLPPPGRIFMTAASEPCKYHKVITCAGCRIFINANHLSAIRAPCALPRTPPAPLVLLLLLLLPGRFIKHSLQAGRFRHTTAFVRV